MNTDRLNPDDHAVPHTYKAEASELRGLLKHAQQELHSTHDHWLAEKRQRQSIEQDYASLLKLVTDIRWACGDEGKRMQDELVTYIGELKQENQNGKAALELLFWWADRLSNAPNQDLYQVVKDGYRRIVNLASVTHDNTQSAAEKANDPNPAG